jgi:hypothetical protein
MTKFTAVRIIHTFVWFTMAAAVTYIFYVGVTGRSSGMLYVALILAAIEVAALLLNNWKCPLSRIAKQLNASFKEGDDVYLPKSLARNTKWIFGSMLAIGLLLLVIRTIF